MDAWMTSKSAPRRARFLRCVAAALAGVAWLMVPPFAIAQTQPAHSQPFPESRPPASGVSDQQLDEVAKAIRQVNTVKLTYAQRIAQAPQSDKARIVGEANGALVKAVTDQGLSVDEYNAILITAQTDATLRQKLVERVVPSAR
jgi:Domain of unknown function (DUF4168)